MFAGAIQQSRLDRSRSSSTALAALLVFECDEDGPHLVIPRPEVQIVVRFGPLAGRAVDVHAFGARPMAHRKLIQSGQRSVTARLRLDAPEAVLGVPASEMAGRIVGLEELWGHAATQRLCARLADSRDNSAAAAVLDSAIAERFAKARAPRPSAKLALAAADRLRDASVNAVAHDLGVSERHLRRVFRETVGVSPKTFAKLARFHRALRAARQDSFAGWAGIADAAGYYDQAHLIAEFRALAGVTPRALLRELPPLALQVATDPSR